MLEFQPGHEFPGVSSPPRAMAMFSQHRTPPTLPFLQHTQPNTSQRSQGPGSCIDWPIPVAEAKFPGVKGFYIHILHYLSMAPDWNSWFTQGLVNRDSASLVFPPCSLQVDDSSNNDNFFFLATAQLQHYYSEKPAFKLPMLTWCNRGNQTTWGIKYQGESVWEIV